MGRVALSTGLAGVSGTVGDLVFEQRPGGPVVRPRSTTPPRRTEATKAGERRMVWLAAAWNALDEGSFAAWSAYAEGCAVRNPATGAWVAPRAYNLFCKYAGKVRQVDPAASLEGFRPPARPFGGDGVEIRTLPSGGGQGGGSPLLRKVFDPTPSTWETTPKDLVRTTLASSPSADPPPQREGLPAITFAASLANTEGVVTELMVQPLANARRRAYMDRYVSKGFVAFAGAESVEVPLPVGAYACAYRFVRRDTGQETAIMALGVVVV